MKRNLIISIICVLLIALWSYAAISKILEFTTFGSQLRRQPLPVWSIPWLQWGLPVIEMGIALLINFQRTRLTGFIISSGMMTLFTFYVLFALTGAFGNIPCSCAGLISALRWKGHLVFNTMFTIISFAGIFLIRQKENHFTWKQRATI